MSAANLKDCNLLEQPSVPEELLVPDGEFTDEPSLSPEVAAHLGEQLRAFYSHLMNEPVPDRFTHLLEQLGQKQSANDGG